MPAMRGASRALRVMAVAAVAVAPFAALQAHAAVETGDATAVGPGVVFENTGGNVEFGTGHSESRVVVGDPASVPAPPDLSTLSTPRTAPHDPAAAAVARARALVDAARARALAQVEEARRQAEEAAAKARQDSEDARARSDAQSEDARARAEASSSSYDDD